jgi:hypothetical protein
MESAPNFNRRSRSGLANIVEKALQPRFLHITEDVQRYGLGPPIPERRDKRSFDLVFVLGLYFCLFRTAWGSGFGLPKRTKKLGAAPIQTPANCD